MQPHQPIPLYDSVQQVTAAFFDNYSTQQNYSARHNADTQGERLDMTNWATGAIYRSPTLASIDFSQVSLFRPNFDKYSVVPLCHPHHPDLTTYRSARWVRSFAEIKAGTFFTRPTYQPPVAQHLEYRCPIWGKLQSSNAHVRDELDVIRGHPAHIHSRYMLIGGDGLAITRINHEIARNFQKYLFSDDFPAVIPIQGEHPHGTAHVAHMGWRPYSPLLVPLARAIGHTELKADFTVSDFNDYDHGLCILTEGVAQYFIELEKSGGPSLALDGAFMRACAQNIDLEWLSHFLFDFGFMYWDLRQSVRGNKSATIDMIWRESVAFMHTPHSNKTQYAPMAIMRIFWSEALSPELATVYHHHRTISLLGLPGHNVGWDMPIEKENLACAGLPRPTKARVEKFIQELNFLGPVSRGLERLFRGHRQTRKNNMKKIATDVQAVVDHLKETLGATWAQASIPRAKRHSKLVKPPLSQPPWVERDTMVAANGGRDFEQWIKSHLDDKVTWM